jgi:hypothetical protein
MMNPCGTAAGCLASLVIVLSLTQAPQPTDKAVKVECHGQLRDGIVAVGGESTGTTLRFQGITWELQFADREGKAFAQSRHKQPVTITGTLRRVTGVEKPTRWIVDVDRYASRDAEQIPEGATVSVLGTLTNDPKVASQWLINTGAVAYPVKLSSQSTPTSGQRVTLSGRVEAVEPANAAQPFLIVVAKIEAAKAP